MTPPSISEPRRGKPALAEPAVLHPLHHKRVSARVFASARSWPFKGLISASALWLAAGAPVSGAEVPKAPVPASPFLPVIYHYADTLLDRGRDTYGPVKTGLLLSALDRTTLAPLTNRPPAPAGIREGDRAGAKDAPLTGANPQHDQNLLRLLFTLSELSGKPKYSNAAASALDWFLNQAGSTNTQLLPWGEHLAWDVSRDEPVAANGAVLGTHEFFRPWLLWDRCFDLAPDASKRFALGLWAHQVSDPRTGAFDHHAGFAKPAPRDALDFPRHAGFYIRTWAMAYARTRDERFFRAVDTMVSRFERKRHPATGWIEAHTGQAEAWVGSALSLAIDCAGAAHHLPEPLAARLRACAQREDERFCALPHDLKRTGGFVTRVQVAAGQPAADRTPLWKSRSGGLTTAQLGLMCVARYENTGRVPYRELIHSAADAYLAAPPEAESDLWPGALGHAISLELAAWRSAARAVYLERARALGRFALDRFFDQSPLPRASLKNEHYETITGADTLALALVELHLHVLHITAVRCPPNTIDR